MKNYNDPVTQDPKRENKRTRRFVFLTAAVILLSCLILAVCIFGIASRLGEEEEHTPEGSPEYTDETLASQQELREKFGVYTHVSENGKNVTLFSEEQIASIEKAKADGTLPRLGYDEIMFLINDSLNLYEKYDRITLMGKDGSQVIECEHASLSSLDKEAAQAKYSQMTSDVYNVILHRISTLDAGLFEVTRVFTPPSQLSGIGYKPPSFYFQDEKTSYLLNSVVTGFYAMTVCDADPNDENAYRVPLRAAVARRYPDKLFTTESDAPSAAPATGYPLLILNSDRITLEENGVITTCFPTQGWRDKMPYENDTLTFTTLLDQPDFVIERYLRSEYVIFDLVSSSDPHKSRRLFTVCDEESVNKLTSLLSKNLLYIALDDTVIPESPFDYYMLTLSSGEVLKIPCDEKYGAIVSTRGMDGFYSPHCVSAEFVRAARETGAAAYEYFKDPENAPKFPIHIELTDAEAEFNILCSKFYASFPSEDRHYLQNSASEYSVLHSLELSEEKTSSAAFTALRDHVVANPECERSLLHSIRSSQPYSKFNELLFNILLTSNEKLTEYCTTNGIVDKGAVLRLLSERYDEFLVQ